MEITSKWAIIGMDCYPEENGKTDVVFNVHWTLTATDGVYQGYVYGAQPVTLNASSPFTPYNELNEEQVVGWVQSAIGEERVAAYEANVIKQINDQIKPPVSRPPLPWFEPVVVEIGVLNEEI